MSSKDGRTSHPDPSTVAVVIESKDLVALAMSARGIETPADLARALGLASYSSPRRVKRWIEGENEPDYSSTVRLLDLAGMLRSEPGETGVAAGLPALEDPRDLLAGLASVVAVSQSTNEAILERLERIELALRAQGLDGGDPLSADGGS